MYFERFYGNGLAQAEYLVECQSGGEAMIVDPLRDVYGSLRGTCCRRESS